MNSLASDHFWWSTSCDRCPCLDKVAGQMILSLPFSSYIFSEMPYIYFSPFLHILLPTLSCTSHFRAPLQSFPGMHILSQLISSKWLYRNTGQKTRKRNEFHRADCSLSLAATRQGTWLTSKQLLWQELTNTNLYMYDSKTYQILYVYIQVNKIFIQHGVRKNPTSYSPERGSLPIIKTFGKFITISCWRTS